MADAQQRTSGEVSSQDPQSAPAPAAAEAAPSETPAEESSPSPKPKSQNSDASLKEDGKDPKESTPKGRKGRNGKEKEKDKDKDKGKGKSKEDGKDNPGEGKPKKEAPYVNEDRVKTGGAPREKLSPEELTTRMERIRLNNEKIKERRATVQADEQAFQESQAALRAKQAERAKMQANIDEKRAANAKRKMERASGREWDNFKKGAPNVGSGTNASMHAPKSPDANAGAENGDGDVTEMKNGLSTEQGSWGFSVESERGRGRGRGTGRARGRDRGARGGRGGGPGDSRREKAPHIKGVTEDKSQGSGVADWGAAADEWGKVTDADVSQQTGIAITTEEDDPWGVANSDDPWGTANGDDPWSTPATQKN